MGTHLFNLTLSSLFLTSVLTLSSSFFAFVLILPFVPVLVVLGWWSMTWHSPRYLLCGG